VISKTSNGIRWVPGSEYAKELEGTDPQKASTVVDADGLYPGMLCNIFSRGSGLHGKWKMGKVQSIQGSTVEVVYGSLGGLSKTKVMEKSSPHFSPITKLEAGVIPQYALKFRLEPTQLMQVIDSKDWIVGEPVSIRSRQTEQYEPGFVVGVNQGQIKVQWFDQDRREVFTAGSTRINKGFFPKYYMGQEIEVQDKASWVKGTISQIVTKEGSKTVSLMDDKSAVIVIQGRTDQITLPLLSPKLRPLDDYEGDDLVATSLKSSSSHFSHNNSRTILFVFIISVFSFFGLHCRLQKKTSSNDYFTLNEEI